jgi:hypothetical protein
MKEEEPEQLTVWGWIKVIGWITVVAFFGLLVFPYWVFNKLKVFCGSETSKCSPDETIDWLTSTTFGGVLLFVALAVAIWIYYPLVASYSRMIIEKSAIPPVVVWSGAMAITGLWLAFLAAVIMAGN